MLKGGGVLPSALSGPSWLGVKLQARMFSQLWRLDVQGQGVTGAPPEASLLGL